MTVRAPRAVTSVPIMDRSARLAEVVLESNLEDLVAMGARAFPHGQAPASTSIAFHVTDAVMDRLAVARRGAKSIGQSFSISAVAARLST